MTFVQRVAPAPRPTTPRPREQWVDAAKGVAIVLVVLHHTMAQFALTGHSHPVWQAVTAVTLSVRMPMFFLVSGLFAASAVTAPLRRFARTKLALFLWVYAVWAVLHTVGRVVMSGDAAAEALLQFLVVDTELWYLVALPVFFVAARLLRPLPASWQLAAAAALSVTLGYGLTPVFSGSLNSMGQYFVYFLVGLHASTLIREAVARPAWWWPLTAVAVWAATVAAVAAIGGPVQSHTMSTVVPVVAVPAALLVIAQVCRWRGSALLSTLGRRSMHVYVMHFPVIAVLVAAVVALVAAERWWAAPAVTAVTVAVTLVVGQVLSRVPGVFELPRRRPTRQVTCR